MKNFVKNLFKLLPGRWSEIAQGIVWSTRSAAFVAIAPLVRYLSNTRGGQFPVPGMPRGAVSAVESKLSVIEIPIPAGTPPVRARTLGRLQLEEFADVPKVPKSVMLADLSQCQVDGTTGAVLDAERRLVIELSPYAKRSPVDRPWDHPAFYRFKSCRTVDIAGTSVLLANPNGAVYFHWLLELFPRLGLLQAHGLLPENFTCLVPRTGGFVADSLRAAGVPSERMQTLEPGVRYQTERLLTTSDLFPQGTTALLAPWLQETFLGCGPENGRDRSPQRSSEWQANESAHEKLENPSMVGHSQLISADRPEGDPCLWASFRPPLSAETQVSQESPLIYITRRDSGLRTVEDEAALITIVEELGGRVVMLEGMDVREQAALFNHSRCIVTPHGSALSNLVFCRPGTQVLELYSPSYVRVLYPRIGTALNLDYWYLIGQGKREQSGRPSLYASIKIDPLEFRNTLLAMLDSASGLG